MGDAAAARDQFAALLPIHERVLGAEHPTTLAARRQLIWWIGQAGDAVGARDQYSALLRVAKRVLGPEDRGTLAVLKALDYWASQAVRQARQNQAVKKTWWKP